MRRLFRRWRRWRRLAGAGGAELFVYGECVCGWACMCTEGSSWPECPGCGRQVMPPWPADRRLEAAVVLVSTAEAVEEVRRIGAAETNHSTRTRGTARRFTEEDVRRGLEERAAASGRDARIYLEPGFL